MEVLKINGHDYSAHISQKGVDWRRNDLDSEKTQRTKDGKLRRDKIGTKRTIGYKLINMTTDQLAQLDSDLSSATFYATYLDLHGVMTKEFYCSTFAVQLESVYGSESSWGSASFSIIEV